MDEVAFFRLEGSADSDVEIQTSVRRGGLSFPHPRLVKISTPYAKSGILFDDFKRSWGVDDPDRLVWKASSLLMNPGLTSGRLDRERRLDPDRFAREYEAEFAEDLSAFLPGEWVDSTVMNGRHEIPHAKGIQYVAAVDPSGGSGRDAFTLAIVHVEGRGNNERLVHDVMRGWKRAGSDKIDLEGVVAECAAVLKKYRCTHVVGDRYSVNSLGSFPARRYLRAVFSSIPAFADASDNGWSRFSSFISFLTWRSVTNANSLHSGVCTGTPDSENREF